MAEFLNVILSESFLSTIVRVFVPLMFAAMSAYVASLAGIPNIAVEGVMLMSALFAVLGSYWTQSSWLGLLIAIAAGLVMSLILVLCTINMGTNPILVGIALNTFSTSFTVFLLYLFTQNKGTSASLSSKVLPVVTLPVIKDIPILRALLCAAYSSAMILPGSFVVHKIMSVHPFKRKHGDDLTGDSDVMGNNR